MDTQEDLIDRIDTARTALLAGEQIDQDISLQYALILGLVYEIISGSAAIETIKVVVNNPAIHSELKVLFLRNLANDDKFQHDATVKDSIKELSKLLIPG